jgi:hemolysin activation/secretion protein
MSGRRWTACVPLLVWLLWLSCGIVTAQQAPPDAGTILRETERAAPEAPPPPGAPILAPEAQPPPLEAAGPAFPVAGFRISGNTVFPAPQLLALIASWKGDERTLGDLEAAAGRITQFYRDHGYLIARAYVPAQDVKGGIVTIAVSEGRYGKKVLDNHSRTHTAVLERYLTSAELGSILEEHRLERALLLIQDTAQSAQPATALHPGSEPGTSDLDVQIGPVKAAVVRAEADDYGIRATGQDRIGGSLELNNPLGIGDTFDAHLLTTTNHEQDYGRLAYGLPFGGEGVRVQAAYVDSYYRLGEQFAALDADGHAQISSLALTYPALRTLRANLTAEFGVDWKRLEDDVESTDVVNPRSNWILRAGVHGDRWNASGGATTVAWSVESGDLHLENPKERMIDAEGPQTAGRYFKSTLTATCLQPLDPRDAFYLSATGQWASKNLDSAEQLSLGGPYGVRAYPVSEAVGAEAYVLTAELRRTLPAMHLPGRLTGTLFADTGGVRVNVNPYGMAANSRYLSGTGVGLAWAEGEHGSLKISYAHRLGASRDVSAPDEPGRVWAEVAAQF